MKNWREVKISELEHDIIQFWRDINVTEKIIEKSKHNPQKVFLDGPPFATGNMHYGHILVSTVKDTFARYLTMRGYYVDRRNVWDTHGVPMEALAKKEIGYNTKKELLKYGIDKHNMICRNLVEKCSKKWSKDFANIS